MKWLNWFWAPKPIDDAKDVVIPELGMTANTYKQTLDSEWDRYLKWRDDQVCVGCGKRFGDKGGMSVSEWVDSGATELDDSMWVTENQCAPCWKKGVRGGKTRADYLEETGNQYL